MLEYADNAPAESGRAMLVTRQQLDESRMAKVEGRLYINVQLTEGEGGRGLMS